MLTSSSAQPTGWPQWFRGAIQGKTRIALAWIFAALLVLSARQYPTWPGILLCFIGATLRFWASGYLRKDSRPAVGGPYALVRNPLYLGTYLMALGTALAIENWWLLIALTVIFGAIYHYIILDEETKLERIFGEPYRIYCKRVPRFFPKLWVLASPGTFFGHLRSLKDVNPEIDHRRYSLEIAMKNKAYEAYLSFIGLIGFVALIAFFWQRI